MTRGRITIFATTAIVVVVIAVVLARTTIFAGSASGNGICNRELRPGQPASESLTAQAENQSRALAPATIAATPPPAAITQSKAIAQARLEGGNAVVAKVGDQTITLGDLRASEETVRSQQSPNGGVPSRVIQQMPPSYRHQMEIRNDLIKQAGVPNVALAGLISDDATYQYALEQGCAATPQSVNARVAQDKGLASKAHDPLPAAYGPDYWTKIYPEVIRRLLAENRLRAALTASSIPSIWSTASATPPATAWNSLTQRVIQHAHVTVQDPTAIAPATVSGALKYLRNYYAAGFGG